MQLDTRKWTQAEYEKLTQVGLLADNERVELILGEIVKMAPADPLHSNAVSQGQAILAERFGDVYSVRSQVPLQAGTHSEPEPDFALIPKAEAARLLRQRKHPQTADLVIEMAHTSLHYDKTVKPCIYALAQVPLYWVVDLRGELVEVFSEPGPDPESATGWSYAATRRYRRGEFLPFGGRDLKVDELLSPVE